MPKVKPPIQGYDAVAIALTDLFEGVKKKKNSKQGKTLTARGIASNATKLLNSNYNQSGQGRNGQTITAALDSPNALPGVGESPSPTSTATGLRSTRSSTRSTNSHDSPSLPTPTHLDMGRCYDDDAAASPCLVPVTTLDRGMKRLHYHDIVRLRVGDSITCVVPANNTNHHDLANAARDLARDLFKRSLVADRLHSFGHDT